jgi:hypothetical protein
LRQDLMRLKVLAFRAEHRRIVIGDRQCGPVYERWFDATGVAGRSRCRSMGLEITVYSFKLIGTQGDVGAGLSTCTT